MAHCKRTSNSSSAAAQGSRSSKGWSRTRLEWGGEALFHQAQGDGLVEAGPGQELADGRLDALALPARGDGQRHGPILRDVVVAVNPRHLLDEVDLALQIAPPRRW